MTGGAYTRWQDAMFTQHRVLEGYRSSKGMSYLGMFVDDMNSKHPPEHAMDRRVLAGIHVQALVEAEPVWVSEDACRLVDHARESFEPEPVLRSDPFVPCGFALLAEPLILDDAPVTERHPNRTPAGKIPVRAMSWMAVHDEDAEHGCFWISFFVDVRDEVGIFGDPRWRGHLDKSFVTTMPLAVAHIWQWTWGEAPWREPDKLWPVEDEDLEASVKRAKHQTQTVQTLWRIGSQFVPQRERPDRHMRRQAERKKMKVTDGVTVIRLRRAREPAHEEEESDRTLTVRHLVRGYWGTRHTREGPRQVWVAPYIRGDDHLPFRQTTRAWEFTR